jgi:ATP-dependent DNA helicase RecG
MEREGSGYDRMYEVLLASGKKPPSVSEGNDRVVATVRKHIARREIVDFMVKAHQTFYPTQKELIALGLIAQHESLTAIELVQHLELQNSDELQSWLGRLRKWGLIRSRGHTKATEYFVEPDVLRRLAFEGATTLKGIEKHRLQALILQDLGIYQEVSIGDLHERIGSEIPKLSPPGRAEIESTLLCQKRSNQTTLARFQSVIKQAMQRKALLGKGLQL